MQLRVVSSALILSAVVGLASVSTPAAARDKTGLEGHWSGVMLTMMDETSDAELSLDDYGCYALSLKKEHGIETGFYTVKAGRVELKDSTGVVRRMLEKRGDEKLHLLSADGKPLKDAPQGCCALYKD